MHYNWKRVYTFGKNTLAPAWGSLLLSTAPRIVFLPSLSEADHVEPPRGIQPIAPADV